MLCQSIVKKSHFIFLLLLLFGLVSACGGGGGGGNGGGGGGGGGGGNDTLPTLSGSDYLFYLDDTLPSPAALFAYDPDTGATSQVSGGDISPLRKKVLAGDINFDNATVANVRFGGVFYVENGKFYFVSAAKSAALKPQQVSSFDDNAVEICVKQVTDLPQPYVFFTTATSCGSNESAIMMINLDMTSSDNPLVVPAVGIEGYFTAAGVQAWLGFDGSDLLRYNADFTSSNVVKGSVSNVQQLAFLPPNDVVLRIDDQIYVYNLETKTLSSQLTNAALTSDIMVISNGDSAYYHIGGTIYKITGGATPALSTVGTDTDLVGVSDDQGLLDSGVVNGYVLYTTPTANSQTMKSMDPAGNIATLVDGDTEYPLGLSSINNGTQLYYNIQSPDATSVTAVRSLPDGTVRQDITNALWAGFQLDMETVPFVYQNKALVLADYSDAANGVVLKGFDTATDKLTRTLGTLPVGVGAGGSSNFWDFGSRMLGTLGDGSGGTDVYYVDVDSANSLDRVTSDTTQDEYADF